MSYQIVSGHLILSGSISRNPGHYYSCRPQTNVMTQTQDNFVKNVIFLECLNSLDVGCWSNCKSQIAKWLLCQIFVVKSFNSLATELSSERPRVVISDYQATSRENFIPANIPLTSPWWLNFDGNLFTLQGRCTLCSPVLRDCDKLKSIWSAKVSSLARILMTFLHATPLFCLIKMFCYDCNLNSIE